MTIVNYYGFETGAEFTGNGREIAGFSGIGPPDLNIVTSPVRSGTYACQIAPSTTTSQAYLQMGSIPANGHTQSATLGTFGTLYFGMGVYITTPPGSLNEQLILFRTGVGSIFTVRLRSDRKLAFYDSADSLIDISVMALPLATWVYVEVMVNRTSGLYEVRFDGAVDSAGAFTAGATDISAMFVGKFSNLNSQKYDVTIDDIILSNDDFKGNGYCTAVAVPIAAGAASAWTNGTGSTFAEVDEVPPSTTDYLQNTSGTNAAHTFGMTVAATLGISSATLLAVKAIIDMAETVAATTLASVRIRVGATNSDTTAADIGNADPTIVAVSQLRETNPSTGVAWTPTTFDTIEVGPVKGGAAGSVRAYAVYLTAWIRTSFPGNDDPLVMQNRAQKLRRVKSSQMARQALDLTVAVAVEDMAPIEMRPVVRPFRSKLYKKTPFMLMDPVTLASIFDDGVPVTVHARARNRHQPVDSWRIQQLAEDWSTLSSLEDDGVPVTVHARARNKRNPTESWHSPQIALDWSTLASGEDDFTPVALRQYSYRVRRRWSNQVAALDWSTLSSLEDDQAVMVARTMKPWPRRSVSAIANYLIEGVGADDEFEAPVLRSFMRKWSRNVVRLIAPQDSETLASILDDQTPVTYPQRQRAYRRKRLPYIDLIDYITLASTLDDQSATVLRPTAIKMARRNIRLPLPTDNEASVIVDDGSTTMLWQAAHSRKVVWRQPSPHVLDLITQASIVDDFTPVLVPLKQRWRTRLRMPVPITDLTDTPVVLDDQTPVSLSGRSWRVRPRRPVQIVEDWNMLASIEDDGTPVALRQYMRRKLWSRVAQSWSLDYHNEDYDTPVLQTTRGHKPPRARRVQIVEDWSTLASVLDDIMPIVVQARGRWKPTSKRPTAIAPDTEETIADLLVAVPSQPRLWIPPHRVVPATLGDLEQLVALDTDSIVTPRLARQWQTDRRLVGRQRLTSLHGDTPVVPYVVVDWNPYRLTGVEYLDVVSLDGVAYLDTVVLDGVVYDLIVRLD